MTMAVSWTLTHNDVTQSLRAWGIENPVLNRYNLGVETLAFTIPTADIFAEPVFAWDDRIELRRDGVPYFIGKVTALPAVFGSDGERQRYVVSNAWQTVQSIIYQQRYTLSKSDFSGLIGSWSSRVVLGQDQWGKPQSCDSVITQVGQYANRVGGELLTVASLPAFAVPPIETVRDITCAEAIRRMLAYTPDAVGWFGYDSGATVLTIQRRSALTAISLDLDDKDNVEIVDGLNPLNELKPRGVVIVFIHTEENEDGTPKLRETRQTAGATTGPRVIFATVTLSTGEAAPAGLASQYYNALSTLQWAGSIRLHEAECTGLLRPGKVVNLLNGRTAWETMAATVQSSTEELFTGITTVEIGAAEHLGLSDFVDMMRRWRERPPAGEFPLSQHNGTEGIDEQEEGTDPSPDDPLGPSGTDPEAGTPEGNDDAGQPYAFSFVRIPFCNGEAIHIARVLGIDEGPAPTE
jgi:hypothetical protein